MKSLIALLVLTVSFSAHALTVECSNGAEVRLNAHLDLTTSSEDSLTLREDAAGTLTLDVTESDLEDFSLTGEYLTLKKGAYYKDQEVNVLTVTGQSNGRSIALRLSNDPALRTDAERNRIVVDGYDAGVFSCSVSK